MNLSAILVVRDWLSSTSTPSINRKYGRFPISCTEICGESVLRRTITRLRRDGVGTIFQVHDSVGSALPCPAGVETVVVPAALDPWRAAQQTLRRQADFGVDAVIVMAIGAYVEFNLENALEFHRSQGSPLTQMSDKKGPLDFWIVDCKWFRNVEGTLPFSEKEFPGLPIFSPVGGYVNRLANVRDLRTLVLDTFLSKCQIKPAGREVRPGVWVADGARVHKMARLVAPVYLGRSTRIGRSAVITRYSNLESHTDVGEGTTVHASSVLSHTVVGRGLDISNAVVEGTRFVELAGGISMEINDPKLLRDTFVRGFIPAKYDEHIPESAPGYSESAPYSQYPSRVAGMFSVAFSRSDQ